MPLDPLRLYRLVLDVALRENIALLNVGEGIFFLPERAFVYNVGKAIAVNATSLFGSDRVRWLPETKVGSGGPSDLVYEVEGQKGLVIEFKRRGNIDRNLQDLTKLADLDGNKYHRFFCVLVDAWPEKLHEDPRITNIESCLSPPKKVARVKSQFDFFSTLDRDFVNQVCCVVCLWEIT
ncbi:MAG: hypothetical protein EPO61_01895 [Nitrospirae bacterium]|nr:MAG: hypothetical protein EPO61_01895 [Nitrospirota bacterium]